ncbi:type II toxin-antitoxin system VapC family toxin [Patescibacteria group bacterium]|nr:type II toxin-antitoxin system VapC family toxin [Patescibacteria group bacterium]MBU1200220.1 type II toxin-antitoxin system VapC family toxin [Patescibacteria group bacterium]MBU1256157.1 type II toxin-antitoxin system VapC family toxin [Patescibacteria group bacterium]MBU1457901.1 type II toxin-antitoxin system VapC family toxin [Patescibacteria group bacterium]
MAANKQPSVVIDSSAILSYLLPDESPPKKISHTFQLYQQNKLNLIAPELLKIEVGNTLKTAILQKRLQPKLAKQILKQFLLLPIRYTYQINYLATLNLTIKHNLSFYDALYLHLSQINQVPLITIDKKLAKLSLLT